MTGNLIFHKLKAFFPIQWQERIDHLSFALVQYFSAPLEQFFVISDGFFHHLDGLPVSLIVKQFDLSPMGFPFHEKRAEQFLIDYFHFTCHLLSSSSSLPCTTAGADKLR